MSMTTEFLRWRLWLSLVIVGLATILTGGGLWLINPDKAVFPAMFVALCLVGAIVIQPDKDLVGVFKDAHWSHSAIGALLIVIGALNVKSLTDHAYFVPMSIGFVIVLLALSNAIGRRIKKRSSP